MVAKRLKKRTEGNQSIVPSLDILSLVSFALGFFQSLNGFKPTFQLINQVLQLLICRDKAFFFGFILNAVLILEPNLCENGFFHVFQIAYLAIKVPVLEEASNSWTENWS
jgi:hypothetical protein